MIQPEHLTERGHREGGFTLIEVMIAVAVAGILCASVITVQIKIDDSNRYLFDRTTASRAAHQMMEILVADDIDSMLLQNGNTFAVTGMKGGAQTGTISISDLGWVGAGMSYRIRLTVPIPSIDNQTFVLEAVRTRT
jgi:prepilin-type N-terminal cleavage/methylation domain-containing protein